ncbi:Retrotransposon protein [Seminavis robusta]|uniref:Retrotransposon protein n=1 Tax=Seminavis robusta TaxID=568900 RepID=A0A9N8HHT2_9STRA|nr:Retrotransposon protein [Seminavis robusta]|eukprot:Sro730_g193950.1 Retrotransposon protein (152) ;mRNA; r:1056-1511
MWRALLDRGANVCILCKDVRVIHRYGQFIDLSGIDDHTVQNLQRATAAAYILTDHGPLIGLIHQGAAMSHGKTILSPGQLELFGCRVHNKALTVTGLDTYFVTPNGFRVPMAIQSGLPYVQLPPPTDQELSDSSIPHVYLTSPHILGFLLS